MTGLYDLLSNVQTHISEEYSAALNGKADPRQIKAYIEKYIMDTGSRVETYE